MEGVTKSYLRLLLAYNKSFHCADVRAGDSVPFHEASNPQSTPRRRDPAKILDVGDTEVTAKFQYHTFKVARYCLREEVDVQDVGGMSWNPTAGGSDTVDGMPSVVSRTTHGGDRWFLQRDGDPD